MGIFSSKYKTYVGTSISRFADTDSFISSKKKGLISGITRNEDVTDHTLDSLINSSGFRAKKAFRYGESSYTFGRPNDTLFAKADSVLLIKLNLKEYLETTYGATVDYTYFGVNNYYHKFYKELLALDYVFQSKEILSISSTKLFPVYLHTAELLVNPSIANQVNDSYTVLVPNNGNIISLVSTTEASSITAQITYRWDSVTEVAEEVSTVQPTVTNSVTTTEDSGTVDFVTEISNTTTVTPSTVVTASHIPSTPPTTYQDTKVVTTTVGVTSSNVVVTEYYTASAQSLVTVTETNESFVGTKNTVATKYNQESLIISDSFAFTEEELSTTYLLASYHIGAGNSVFFEYEIGTDTIPELEDAFETSYTTPGNYLPRLYFRWNHISEGLDKNTVAYTNGKKLAKKIGIDYDDVIEAVHKIDEDRTQADLDKIRSVFLTYALPADATDQIELKYLFKHFKDWHSVIGGYTTTESLGDFNTNYQLSDSNEHVLVIEDKRFKITIGMQSIWKRTVTGVFDSVGKYGALKGELTTTTVVGESITTVRTFPWHVYRHQTSETTYEEYHVVGLETKYYVEGNHTSASGYTKDVEDAKDILYVPINYSLIDQFTLFEQEELMYKSMQIVANSLVVVKVKWYQRGGWSTLFKIAAIVAAFYGFTQGLELLSALAAIASVSIAWALELVFAYLVDYLTSVIAIKLFVKAAGEEIALLTAIVLAATGYIQGGGFKSPFATQMLQYSNSIFAEMNASFMREIESLKGDYNSFITEAKTEFKEISDELKKFDNPNKNLTAYLLNSTPEEFLNKTHIGNIGTKVFDVTRNYVDISLRLPYRPTYLEV